MAEVTQKSSLRSDKEHEEPLAQKLSQLHATLARIDRELTRGHVELPVLAQLGTLAEDLAAFVDRVAPEARERFLSLVEYTRQLPGEIEARLAAIGPSAEIPSRPLFGLPLARRIPQDIHSVIDYVDAAGLLLSAILAKSTKARIAGAVLGGAHVARTVLADARLGVVKVMPIEAHEAADHVWGAAAIAAPFVFGYYKKDPFVAAMHVLHGASMIIVSLFTDFRAAKGPSKKGG